MRATVAIVVVVVVAAGGVARADENAAVAVLPLDGLGVDDATLGKLDLAVRNQLATLDVQITARADVKKAAADATGKPDGTCEGQVECLAKVGTAVGAGRVVTGSAGLVGDELHLTLKLVDVGLGSEVRTVEGASPRDQGERSARETVFKLVDPDRYGKSGTIALTLETVGAQVVVDGVPRGTTPLFGAVSGLAPGRREVEVSFAGKKTFRDFVDVTFDEPTTVDLADRDDAIIRIPHSEALAAQAAAAAAAKKKGMPVLMLTGFGVTAVGVLALGGAVFEYFEAEAAFDRLTNHDQIPSKDAVEDLAKNRNAIAAYGILLTGGAVAVGAGAGLIGFSALE